jgi:hypothetical protein
VAAREVETAIDIAAPPADVWEVLTDFAGYARWNPFIVDAGGQARPGRALFITIKPPGWRQMSLRPTVLVADPARALRWRGKLLVPGLFDGEHYFKLEAAGEGCHFVHGEQFSGLLVGLMGERFFASVRSGFEAMNEALKARVEE